MHWFITEKCSCQFTLITIVSGSHYLNISRKSPCYCLFTKCTGVDVWPSRLPVALPVAYNQMRDGRVKQTSGSVDQLGDYLNLLTFSARRRLSCARFGLPILLDRSRPYSERWAIYLSCLRIPKLRYRHAYLSLSAKTDFPVSSCTETVTSFTGKSTPCPCCDNLTILSECNFHFSKSFNI